MWWIARAPSVPLEIEAGQALAASQLWTADSKRALLGHLLGNGLAQAQLMGAVYPSPSEPNAIVASLDADPAAPLNQSGPYRDWLTTLQATPAILLAKAGLKLPARADYTFTTKFPEDAGFPWPAVVVAVALGGAYVAAVCYCAEKAAVVLNNAILANRDVRELVAKDAAVSKLVALHLDQEKAAGKQLPPSPVLTQAIDAAKSIQGQIVQRQPQPESPRSGFDFQGAAILAGVAIVGLVAFNLTRK